jgi:PAP2 superfamily protein
MLGRSDRGGNRIHEHDSVPIGILVRGLIVCALLVLGGYLLFVNTRWGQKIDEAAYSGRHIVAPALIEYDRLILDPVSASTLVVAMALILMAGAFRRCLAAAAIIAVGFACAVVGAELLKHALPWHALLPRDTKLPLDLQRHTYPSGHTTIGTSLSIALILLSPTRWRLWMAVIAGLFSASFATGVLFVGWHRPSDALGGIFWSGSCMSLTALLIIALRGKPIGKVQPGGGAFLRSVLLVILLTMIVPLLFTAAQIDATQVAAQVPFLILTLLIAMSSFGLSVWFGWQLRSVDWSNTREARHLTTTLS